MKVVALTGRAGSGKDTAALGIRMLTGSLDPSWLMSMEGCPISGPNRHVVDLKEFFDTSWPNDSTNPNRRWKMWKFSYPVYQIAAVLTGHDPDKAEDLMTSAFKDSYWKIGLDDVEMTGREILQKIGDEGGRQVFGETVWLHRMDQKLKELAKDHEGVIITDCRYPNEGHFLEERWGATIIGMKGRDSGVSQSHSSENQVAHVRTHWIADNSRSYTHLMVQLQYFCTELKISNHTYTWK